MLTLITRWCRYGWLPIVSICALTTQTDERKPDPIHAEIAFAKPNFVVLFLDDAGYGDFGCFGHPTIRTPNIDRMASEGMKLTQFYSASPACTASRYGLMTGRYPIRSGFPWVLTPDSKRGIHDNEITLAEVLRATGYATGCFGKWHLGHHVEFLPLQNGFDEYYGLPYSNDMQAPRFRELPLIEGNETIQLEPDQGELTRRYTTRAIEFIERNQDKPFFLYLPYAMPHLPLFASDRFSGQSARGLYGDVIEEIDWSVGEIMRALRELNLDENTLVILTSDNGPWIIKHLQGGSSGLFRDGKGSTWEGGVRVPCIAWWPGRIKSNSSCLEVTAAIDLLPTFVTLAGGDIPTDRSIDGRDLSGLLTGGAVDHVRESLFFFGPNNQLHAVRAGPWKLHVKTSSQTGQKYFSGKVPLLFNLDHDPSEQHDLTEQHPELVTELLDLIEQFQEQLRLEPPFWNDIPNVPDQHHPE